MAVAEASVPSLADQAPAVLRNYFNTYPNTFLTQHHIQSYEAFIFREMLDIIQSENPLTILKEPLDAEAGIYKYKTEIFVGGVAEKPSDLAIDIGAPIITLDGGKTVRRMFPNEARIRGLTYAANFQADILVRTTWTTPVAAGGAGGAAGGYTSKTRDLQFPKYRLFNIPILLRSKLCATHGADKDLLWEMGECQNDQGGYFIIDGSEKLLITRQEQAFNSVFIQKRPIQDKNIQTYASVICQNPVTKQTRRVALYRMHEKEPCKQRDCLIEDGAIRVAIPTIMGTVPLFALFRALGVESDEEIVRMILPDANAAVTPAMEATLVSSIHDAWPITNRVQALEFLRTLSKGFIIADVLNILNTHLFSHVPNRPLARAQYLAEIVRKMINVEMGMEPSTNRDDIRNQRLLPTGTLLRGLFSECWKDWKGSVRLAVDKMYNYNRMLYQDEDFLNIFSTANLNKVLSSKELNDSIMRGFRGKWGTNQFNMKTGVIQPVARISYLDAMSHTRRVVSDFDTSMKLTGPRHLHPSQVGYFCTAETPTGAHIGATKNMSILTLSSIASPIAPVMNWLFSRGGVIEVSAASMALRATATSVQINGGTIGFTSDPVSLTRVLKFMKWTACLAPGASISFNTADNILRIYLDDGRPLRPLYHLSAGGKWPAVMLEAAQGRAEIPSWRDMVCGTLPISAAQMPHSVEFIDPLAARPEATLADYETALEPHIGCVEYIDPYEGNESYVSWWGRIDNLAKEHTHAEIHPSSLMGLLANMIPFANHNQSPRNQLSCSQSKQGIGYYATNYESRFDTYGSMLCYGEGALCRTIVHEAVAGGAMPYGTNLVFAFCCFNGYNQDDGILFNRSSIERGMFRSLSLRSYTTMEEEDPITHALYRIANPRNVLAWHDLKPGYDYSQLDENGIIREGAVIHDKSVLVGRYLTNKDSGKVSDASLLPTVFTTGRVDKVVLLHQANGMRLVRVRILKERVPTLGDKFSSRHGQKGTMGMLLDAVDMPRTADGMVPDVVVNPHCIPSRMTMAQMLEQVFGKFGAEIGAKINATTFMNDENSFAAIADALQQLGMQREGEEILYSGMTGKMFTSSIFMGPLYFMRLKHLTEDKMNARPAGRKEQRTHQPTGGRGNEGGMRIGEMERDTLIAHGVTSFLQESMMKRSDGTSFMVCNGCGTIPIYNEGQKLYVCPMCDGPLEFQGETTENMGLILPVKKSRTTFSRIEVPYALKLLDQELTTFMNGGMRFLTEKGTRAFREPTEMDLSELLEVQGAEDEDVFAAMTKKRAAATAMAVADLPEEEDGSADLEDEGAPAENETGVTPSPDTPVIDFYYKIDAFKELSNMFMAPIDLDGKTWPSVEHYFHAMKFPDNPEYQETIRKAKDGKKARKLGKTKTYPVREDWKTHRVDVMVKALREKFSAAHPELRAKLLETGNALLREANPKDNYWGIGKEGTGKNKLGELLMMIREEIRAENNASAASGSVASSNNSGSSGSSASPMSGGLAPESSMDDLLSRTGVAETAAANAEAQAQAAAAAGQVPGAAPGTTVVIQQGGAPPAIMPTPVPQPAPSAVPQQQQPPVLRIAEVNAAAPLPANTVQQPFAPPPAPAAFAVPINPVQPVATQVQVGGVAQVPAAPMQEQIPDPDVKVLTVSQVAPPPKK